MARPWQLRDLCDKPRMTAIRIAEDSSEEKRLEAFESGYKAGWDDATAAQQKEQGNISSELGQNLTELTFTYQEAQVALLTNVEDTLQKLFSRVFPETEKYSLSSFIATEVQKIVLQNVECIIVILVAPENCQIVESHMPGGVQGMVQVRPDANLGSGQARLEFGDKRTEIDVEKAMENLLNSVQEFFLGTRSEDRKYG